MEKEEKERIDLIVPDDKEDKAKKKKTLLIVFGSIGTAIITIAIIVFILLLIGIILLALYVNKLKNKPSPSSSENTYVIDEYTSKRYNNLLTYVNNEYHSLSKSDDIEDISVFTISETHISLIALSDSNPIYMDIDTKKDGVDTILDLFKETTYDAGKFANTIQIETINEELDKNVNQVLDTSLPHRTIVTSYLSNNYISYLGMKDDHTFIANTHAIYQNDGAYTSATITNENKLLFDMYYYMLNTEH